MTRKDNGSGKGKPRQAIRELAIIGAVFGFLFAIACRTIELFSGSEALDELSDWVWIPGIACMLCLAYWEWRTLYSYVYCKKSDTCPKDDAVPPE